MDGLIKALYSQRNTRDQLDPPSQRSLVCGQTFLQCSHLRCRMKLKITGSTVLGLRLENCHFTLWRIRSFAGDAAETMMGIDEDGLIRRYMHAKSRPMYVNGMTRARIT